MDVATGETREMDTPETVVEIPRDPGYTLAPGTNLGRYVVIEQLGKGGMGVVYKAYDPELSRLIAIKLLRLRGGSGPRLERRHARLLREAQALAQLSHPNVIAVHDAGTHEGDVFLAMELVAGTVMRKWLGDAERSYREILAVMVDAGRGLAAAHAAGLIHRDFKPDNIILGESGRVCVIDFGLARASGGPLLEDTLPETLDDLEQVETRDRLLSSPLTLEGAVVGTPVYMPPEQLQGKLVDERSDQFAFCVALYEALFGRRPFTGKSPQALTRAMKAGRIREPVAGRKVPAWVRRVVLRGLAADPDERFPSMRELLAALERDPAVARRRMVAAAAVGLLAGLAVFGLVRDPDAEVRTCQNAPQRVENVWDDAAAKRIDEAFLATERPHAADTSARVVRAFETYAANWAAAHTEACEATQVHGTQSQQLLDLRMSCLDRRLQQMAALVEVFSADVDDAVVDRAAQAVLSLPRLERCNDGAALTAVTPPPEGPNLRAEIEQVRKRVDRAHALEVAGRYKDGLPIAANAVDEARRIGYAPLLAEVLYRQGSLADKAAEATSAEKLWYEAARYASESRDDLLAVKCWTELLWNVGYRQTRYAEAMVLYEVALAALARVGDDGDARSQLMATIGIVYIVKGEYEQAIEKLLQALELRERVLGPEHMTNVFVLDGLGLALEYNGNPGDAVGYAERAMSIREANLGADHPDLAFSLTNLGEAYLSLEDFAKAKPYAERAVRIRERTLGSEHPALGAPLTTLGLVAMEQKRFETALSYMRRAIHIFENAVGPGQAGLGGYYQRLAEVHRAMKEWSQAIAAFDRAISIYTAAVGADHPDVGVFLSGKGACLLAQGRARQAIAMLRRSLAICEKAERAECVAEAQFSLARALGESMRSRRRAVELAGKAREFYRAGTKPSAKRELAKVDAWLAAHQ